MKKYLLPALGLVLTPQLTLALGLGDLQQQSALGQPLRVEIPLTDARMWSADQIKVELSGHPAPIVRDVDIEVERSRRGSFILLKSQVPVNEPYMDLKLQVAWPDGTLQREYQLLFDPNSDN